MGLIGWLKDSKDEITLALQARKVKNELEKEITMNHDWAKTLQAAAVDFLLTCVAVLVAYFADPVNLAAALHLLPEHLRLAMVPLVSACLVALRKRIKHGDSVIPPASSGALPAAVAVIFIAGAQPAQSQDLGTYLKGHASILAGLAVIDHQAEKLIEIRLSDRFDFGGCWHGGYRAALFSVARAGEIQPTGLPATTSDLKAYSDGEGWVFGSCNLTDIFAVEGIGGVSFKTASFAGPDVDPLDGTKLAGLIGVKVGKNGYEFGLAGGHYGPVVEQGKVAGFLPSLVAHARVPMGQKATLVGEAAFGRLHDGTLTQSYRCGVETTF